MDFCLNMLLESQTTAGDPEIDRIIWIESGGETLFVIRVNDEDALPRLCTRSELEAAISAGDLRVLRADPFAKLRQIEEDLPEKHCRIRDRAWRIIEPLLSLPPGDIFESNVRGPVIDEICSRNKVSKKTPYKYLRRYWQRGQVKNALLPDYDHCGGEGKPRRSLEVKRGRPNETYKTIELGPGINIGPDERKKLEKGFKLYYLTEHRRTKRAAYQMTLEKVFNIGYEDRNGTMVPVLPPADELPSFRQFVYWGSKQQDDAEVLLAREGNRRFQLRHRAVLGGSTQMAFGPGSVYQMDTTLVDVYLVSSLNRNRIIGRPWMYLMKDVFTRMIVGFSVTLENPSYVSAMLALLNAAEDKVAFCAAHGIEISLPEWPCQHLPEMIVADRGELIGRNMDQLVNALGIRVSNTAPYRADMKGIIERSFRTFNDDLVHTLPGAVRSDRERGDPDHRLQAKLDLKQFRQLVICTILQHNRSRMGTYHLQDFLIEDQVEPIPTELWNWGIQNRSGHLRQIDENLLRLNLLPHGEATVTHRGIRFKGVYYTCERALREHWFSRARQGTRKVKIAYDPRQPESIFLREPNENAIEPCLLVDAEARFKGHAWDEIGDFFKQQREQAARSQTVAQRSKAEFHAQVAQIITSATQQSKAAPDGQSDRARTRGIRDNRHLERELDRPNQTLAPSLPSPETAHGGSSCRQS